MAGNSDIVPSAATPVIHINRSRVDAIRKVRVRCHHCKARATFIEWFQHWYGWHSTCLRCGEKWADGEWLTRPFRPRWRPDRIARARSMWARFKDSVPRLPKAPAP